MTTYDQGFVNMITEEVPDFTDKKHSTPRRFKIDDDVFECARVIPANVGRVLATLVNAEPIQQYDGIGTVLDMVMLPESAVKFAARMQSPVNPISLEQVNSVVEWLMQAYGGNRPTGSSNGSPQLPLDPGTNSTDGAPQEVLTP